MTPPRPLEPFELDPTKIDPARIELVVEEANPRNLPSPLEAPPRPGKRPWLRLLAGGAVASILGLLGIEAWQYLDWLYQQSAAVAAILFVVFAATIAGGLGLALQEFLSLRKLDRAEGLREEARRLMGTRVHGQAEPLLKRIEGLYPERPALRDAVRSYRRQVSEAHDDGEQLQLFSQVVLRPLDLEAYQVVKRAARDIGGLTALSPLGLLDGLIVLTRTMMMLRAIARLYGVRPGAAASLRLVRDSARNIAAAGVGELLSDAAVETAGATVLSMVSARAGQGVVNGLLAARLGLSAMQQCRPLPFSEAEVPSLSQLRKEIFERKP